MKKKVVHVIDSLGRGGAESMLVSLLPDLGRHYDIILVTLNASNDFNEVDLPVYRHYCLHCTSKVSYARAVSKLRRIISNYRPALVRSQLYWSTVVARLATPSGVPFIFSIHSKLSADPFRSKFLYWLEKLTYRKKQLLVAVSQAVLDDYDNSIGIRGRCCVMNNFVNDAFFQQGYTFEIPTGGLIKMLAVGNLKKVKNYRFLLGVMLRLKNKLPIQLDIVGEGDQRADLQEFIDLHQLNVNLLGMRSDVATLLPGYHLYIMCSVHEGFGNAPVEAMAVGLPLLLNDTDTMREVSTGNAIFYMSNDEASLTHVILDIPTQQNLLISLSENGKEIARERYTKKVYLQKLIELYESIL